MYAFASRSDFSAVDEPFYAAYLNLTGLQHPMRDQILQAQPQDPHQVVDSLLGPDPEGCPNVYHKHMTQHMIEAIPRDWMLKVTNVFLIRHPARVVASFAKKYPDPKIEDIAQSGSCRNADNICSKIERQNTTHKTLEPGTVLN